MGGPDDKGGVDREAATQTAEGMSRSVEDPKATRSDKSVEPSLGDLDFGDRYHVRALLGRGGMGDVYRAYDADLSREVALKVIRPDRVDHESAFERFRREVALASRVTHKNVLRVYDLSEKAGLRFLSMQYVEGEDLAALLRRERPLPPDRAVRLARQIVLGLAAAHEEGVVHRDLKPQNILLDPEDNVYVADFGLARSLEDPAMTAAGAVLGSPAYMSPEQVKGDPIDARSDIYSLGVILYELLAGTMPFSGGSAHSVMEQRLHRKPRPLREIHPEVPRYLEEIVTRCLAVDPTARYASLQELLVDLDAAGQGTGARRRRKRFLAALTAGALVVVAAVGFGRLRGHSSRDTALSPKASASPSAAHLGATDRKLIRVLILGIDNRTGDPVLDGTLDEILDCALRRSTRLDPMSGSHLRNLAAAFNPGSQALDDTFAQTLAAREGGRVVAVRGAAVAHGAGFTLSMTAADVGSPETLVSRSMDAANTGQVVATMGRLASDIRSALGDTPPSDAKLVEETGMSSSLEADHEYTIGVAFILSGKDADAVPHLERAIAIDPELARAHAWLVIANGNLHRANDAAKHAKLALKYVDRMGERDRLQFLGDYYYIVKGEVDRAISSYEELLRKWPGDVNAIINESGAYASLRNTARAVELGLRATQEHPQNAVARSNLPGYYIYAGDFDAALRTAQKTLEDLPHPPACTHVYVAMADAALGRFSEAANAYQRLDAIDPSLAAEGLADLAVAQGRLGEAAAILEKAATANAKAKAMERAATEWMILGEIRLRRGDKAGALAEARRAATWAGGTPQTFFGAAMVELGAGQTKEALSTASPLAREFAPDARMYAKLVEGEALRIAGKPRDAVRTFEEARRILDAWPVHYALGRAYLDAGAFAEAHGEFKTCLARKGEGLLVFFDDIPSFRNLPLVTYYLARAQEGLSSPDALDSYKAFLAMEPNADHDPLVEDAESRVGRH